MNKIFRCPKCGDESIIRTAAERIIDGKKVRVWVTSCDSCGKEIKYEEIN